MDAERLARGTKGVVDVKNDLKVAGSGVPRDAGAASPRTRQRPPSVITWSLPARSSSRRRLLVHNQTRRRSRTTWRVIVGLVALCLLAGGTGASAQGDRPIVYIAPIEGIIDLGLAPFVDRVLAEAAAANAAAVILDINTFGGRVDAAVLIRDALLRTRVPTVAFVNKRAISAGALISLAANTIAMADGGTIGAATPVQMGSPGAASAPVSEKTVSYMRKEFRATAESRKRPPSVAEAMVDPDVVIPGLIDKGKLLTLTTSEALQHRVADVRADSLEVLLAHLKLGTAEVRHASANWAERLVRVFTHPVLSSVLMTVGLLGIIVELRTPGFGVPGILGVASLAIFFWGHWLVRLAGWEELLLVTAGVLLIALEIFVIPGFGIAGLLGIAALVGGLTLSVIGAGATMQSLIHAAGRVALSALAAMGGSLVLLKLLPRLPYAHNLVLATALNSGRGYASASDADRRWLGRPGTAVGPLRPAGIAEIDGERVDVVSQGEYIETGAPVEVVSVEGNRIVVRRARGEPRKD
jgi:membrane-bound serine protease (ClpP class)